MKQTVFLVLAIVLFLSACQNNVTKSSEEVLAPLDEGAVVALANPASTNCVELGGTLEIRQNKMGEYGVCLFEDNRQCEEWALFRGDCPVGGRKVTGYDNDAEVYCAITGGVVEGVGTANPMCRRVDGTYCNAQANFDGECPDPNDPNPNAGNVEVE